MSFSPPPVSPYNPNPYNEPPRKSNTTVIWVVVGVVSVVILLAIAGGSLFIANRVSKDDPKPSPSVSVSVSPSPSVEPSVEPSPDSGVNSHGVLRKSSLDEERLVDVLHRKGYFLNKTDEVILSAGYGVCSSFDSGESFSSVLNSLTAVNIEARTAAYFIGASVGALCIQHKNKFE